MVAGVGDGIFQCPVVVPEIFCSLLLSKFRPLPPLRLTSSPTGCVSAHRPTTSSVGRDNSYPYQKESTNLLVDAFFLVAGVGFEPHGLRVMSPTSYQAALPRDLFCIDIIYYTFDFVNFFIRYFYYSLFLP